MKTLFALCIALLLFITILPADVMADDWHNWNSNGFSFSLDAGNSPDRGPFGDFTTGIGYLSLNYHFSRNVIAFEANSGFDENLGGIGVRYERFLCSEYHDGRLAVSAVARGSVSEGKHVSLSNFTGLMKLWVRVWRDIPGGTNRSSVLLHFSAGATYVDRRLDYGSSSGPVGFIGATYLLQM